MKDKRILLRVGSIIEIIYTFVMMVYYILKGRLTDEVIANLFILIIGFIVGVLLFKISLKSIDEIKNVSGIGDKVFEKIKSKICV